VHVEEVKPRGLDGTDKPRSESEASRPDDRMDLNGNGAPSRHVRVSELVFQTKDRYVVSELLGVNRQVANGMEKTACLPGSRCYEMANSHVRGLVREQGIGKREQGIRKREQGVGNREQATGSRGRMSLPLIVTGLH
jgi:hypothetical protein